MENDEQWEEEHFVDVGERDVKLLEKAVVEVDEDAVEDLVRRTEVVVLLLHCQQELVRPIDARH
jgi:hypothetical protein